MTYLILVLLRRYSVQNSTFFNKLLFSFNYFMQSMVSTLSKVFRKTRVFSFLILENLWETQKDSES